MSTPRRSIRPMTEDSSKPLSRVLDDLHFRHTPLLKRLDFPDQPLYGAYYLNHEIFPYDLAVAHNSWGPPPDVRECLRDSSEYLIGYPDPYYPELKLTVAERYGVESSQVLLGIGISGLLTSLISAILQKGWQMIAPIPTFSVALTSVLVGRGTLIKISPQENFGIDYERILSSLSPSTRLLYLTNPNNPTGRLEPRTDLLNFLDLLFQRHRDILVFMDEAFIEFTSEGESLVKDINRYPRLMVFRGPSKMWAVEGVRFGYGLGHPDLVDACERLMPSKQVNAMALPLMKTIYANTTFVPSVRQKIEGALNAMQAALEGLGLKCYPSSTSFVLVEVPREIYPGSLGELVESLNRQGCQVVWGAKVDPLLGRFLRITPRANPSINQHFLEALRRGIKLPHTVTSQL